MIDSLISIDRHPSIHPSIQISATAQQTFVRRLVRAPPHTFYLLRLVSRFVCPRARVTAVPACVRLDDVAAKLFMGRRPSSSRL